MSRRIPVVVLTGAGASRAEPIKLPTMTEFFQQIMDTNRMPKSERISNPNYFRFIFDTLYGSDTYYDLERVMGALYGLSEFTNNDCWKIFQHPKIFSNIVDSIASQHSHFWISSNSNQHVNTAVPLIEKGMNRTYEEYKLDAKNLLFELEWLIREKYETVPNDHIRSVYEPIFNTLIKHVIEDAEGASPIIPFYTTNYDMSVDWFFEPDDDNDIITQEKWEDNFQKEIKYIDGFESKRGWTVKEYNKIDESSINEIFIPYYKLHGSLFWEKRSGRVKKGTNIANDPHNPMKLMLVYPSDKKILNDEPYYFNQRSLEVHLKRTDLLLVIGFSFRDPAIVRSFESALLENDDLRIAIVGPKFDPKYFFEMDQFINRYSDRIDLIEGYFGTEEVIRKIEIAMLPRIEINDKL